VVALTTRSTGLARSSGFAADWRPRFADAYRLELQAWVDGVRRGARRSAPGATGAPGLATARDGLLAAAVCDAAIRSMRAGGSWTSVEVPA